MKKITLSLSYFNDFKHLNKHFENWKDYSSLVKFQIIDDCSSERLVDKIDKSIVNSLDISIYRVIHDIKWNIPGVRNLGAAVCATEWILFCDMDQYFLKKDFLKLNKKINTPNFDKNKFYSFSRFGLEKTAGTMLISKDSFWKSGGYDEDMVGNYGYNDPLLRKQLESVNIEEETFKDIFCQQFEADCTLDRDGLNKNKRKMYKKIKRLPKKNLNILNFDWEKSI
ncbi:glycosyltransferase family 2 protein [Acidimicrobiia bacterium]|nr:glycosyltransferase family 2 protein [Acidimicrobiia bacterium]